MLFLLAAGCDLPGRPKETDAYRPPDQEMSFAALYQQNCAACHGRNGELGPAPPLNDALFLQIVPGADLRNVITKGREGTLMPAFAKDNGGQLTGEQVNVLADGIKSAWGEHKSRPGDLPAYLIPQVKADASDSKALARGTGAFARACASCHGPDGGGGTYGGKENGEAVGSINDPAFLSLISDQALRRLIICGRPDLGMPSYAEKTGRSEDFKPLTPQEIKELGALLASWRQGQSNSREGVRR